MEEMGQSYLNDIKLTELWSQNQLIFFSETVASIRILVIFLWISQLLYKCLIESAELFKCPIHDWKTAVAEITVTSQDLFKIALNA